MKEEAMATWLVEYCPFLDRESQNAPREIPCYCIFPEGEPERWIARTNPALPSEVQKELALLIAEALSRYSVFRKPILPVRCHTFRSAHKHESQIVDEPST
jgi:hypothetical protein